MSSVGSHVDTVRHSGTSMLTTVEKAIKSCKAEQAKINDCIQLYREILQTLSPQPKTAPDETELGDDAATDTTPGEKEDMKLLERALEKALQVRTGTEVSNKDPDRNKKELTAEEVTQLSAASKGNQTTIRSTSKSSSLDRKGHRKPGTSVSSTLGSRSSASYNPGPCKSTINTNLIRHRPQRVHHQVGRKPAVSAPGTHDHLQSSSSFLQSKNKTARGSMLSSEGLGRASAVTMPVSHSRAPVSHSDDASVHNLPQQNRIPCDEAAKWKSLRMKQNRLWDKVIAIQRKPVPGRSRFMERMTAMFPKDWPCGSPDRTRALVDRLTHHVQELAYQCQTRELLAQHIPEGGTGLGIKENKCDSYERLQMKTAEVQNVAVQVKQEWEAWDRWRPEGGCLCPAGANGEVGDGLIAPLPLTITFTTEDEFRELEKLRTSVALLQQEIYLEQALLDTLSPQLASIVPGCPNSSVLRDLYSLLGEGGQRFPSIVLDSEPD